MTPFPFKIFFKLFGIIIALNIAAALFVHLLLPSLNSLKEIVAYVVILTIFTAPFMWLLIIKPLYKITLDAKKMERDFRQFFDSSGDCICHISIDGKFLKMNKTGCAINGFNNPEDAIGRNSTASVVENKEEADEAIRQAAKGETAYVQYKSINKNNRGIWWDSTVSPIRDENGNITSILRVSRDITKQRRIEEKLMHLIEIIESTADFVATANPDGQVTYYNKAARRMLGIGENEDISNIRIPDTHPEWASRIVLDEGIPSAIQNNTWTGETAFLNRDGKEIHVSQTIIAHKAQDGSVKFLSTIARDITERKKLESQLLHSQKMEAVGRLAGGIAHDFNNILTAMLGSLYILQRKMNENDPLRVYVKRAVALSDNASALVNDLLDFSRKQPVNLKSRDLNMIIKEWLDLSERIVGEDIIIEPNLSKEDMAVMADANQMEHLLMNLATNARDAMPNGGHLKINTKLVELDKGFISAYGYGNSGIYALLSFEDTGIGMSQDIKQRIFEPFFTTKETGKGTGLGLAIVYGIVKQHNGYINVYSEVGRGTTFNIYIPLSRLKVVEEIKIETALKVGIETILLAEDDAAVRRASKDMLEDAGYKVIESQDGEDAIKTFKENKDNIHLVILDVIMPKKNGKEVYEEIKKIRPDIKIIFASGYAADIINKEWKEKEGLEFIQKPFMPNEFLKKLRDVLDR